MLNNYYTKYFMLFTTSGYACSVSPFEFIVTLFNYVRFQVCFQHLLRDPSMKLHLASCQFAFHYCFESLQQAETMIKNAASNLASGGYFILTIPDANYIM